jgi:hypothetical protein
MIVFGIVSIIFIVKRNQTNQPVSTVKHHRILEEHLNKQLKCQEKDKGRRITSVSELEFSKVPVQLF